MTRLLAVSAAALLALLVFVPPSQADDPAPDVRIGVPASVFTEVSPIARNFVLGHFSGVMKELTGMTGKISPPADALAVARALDEKTLDLAVFQGHEFAWAAQRYPSLRPLMIAVYHDRNIRACLVVPKESAAKDFGCLKGKDMALALGTKCPCRMFLARHCVTGGSACEPKKFFQKITRPGYPEAALDAVCNEEVACTVVDRASWKIYQENKTGNAACLKVLKESEVFPAACIAYRQGNLPDAKLERFKQGMLDAKDSPRGRQLMFLLQVTTFENVPDDYAQQLANIRKVYAAPEVPPAKTAGAATTQ